jgi:hypothetical protein
MEEITQIIPEKRGKNIMKISYLIEKRKYAELTSEYLKVFKKARAITPGEMKFQILLEDSE